MKRLTGAVLAIAVALALIGCDTGSSNGDTKTTTQTETPSKTTKNVPAKLANDIPDSIQGSATAPASIMRVVAGSTKSQGCEEIKSYTSMMSSMSMMAGMYAIINDEIITQNPGIADAGEKPVTITLTQEMLDKIIVLMGDNEEIDVSEMKNAVGTSFSGKVNYTTKGTDTYKYKIILTVVDEGESYTDTLSWSEDKKKAKLEMNMGEGGGSITFIYDAVEDKTAFAMDSDGYLMNMSIQTKGTGAIVLCTSKYNGNVYTLKGYADDKGGYLTMTYTNAKGNTHTYDETFDAAGNITSDTQYSSAYENNKSDISGDDLEGTDAFVVATDLAAGDYFAAKTDTLTVSNFETSFIGTGYISGGYLAIMPISGTAADVEALAKTTTGIYLFPVKSWGTETTPPEFDTPKNFKIQ